MEQEINCLGDVDWDYYHNIMSVAYNGVDVEDRTGVNTVSYFGASSVYSDVLQDFPLLSVKPVSMKIAVVELMWFINGGNNVADLLDHKVNIWNEWTPAYKNGYKGYQKQEAVLRAYEDGRRDLLDLGEVYGTQWGGKAAGGAFTGLLEGIIKDPYSRRHIVSSWNHEKIPNMALPPCHMMFQVNLQQHLSGTVNLNLAMYQRSADLMLGVPYNIAEYALLMHLLAWYIRTNSDMDVKPHKLIHNMGDMHIYNNHAEGLKEVVCRFEKNRGKYRTEPITIQLNENVNSIFDFTPEDVKVLNYNPMSKIKFEVAV